jgi:hypothetical protein
MEYLHDGLSYEKTNYPEIRQGLIPATFLKVNE